MINFSSSIKKVNMQLANMQDGNHKYHQVYLRLVHSIHRLMKLTQCKFHRRQSGLQRGMVSLYLEVKTCYQTLYDNAMGDHFLLVIVQQIHIRAQKQYFAFHGITFHINSKLWNPVRVQFPLSTKQNGIGVDNLLQSVMLMVVIVLKLNLLPQIRLRVAVRLTISVVATIAAFVEVSALGI